MKKIALILALAFAITTGITIMTVLADMDLAMAYTTIITNGDQASGGCGGAGC